MKKEVSYALFLKSKVYYFVFINEKSLPIVVYEETYEEALEILRKEKENQ